MSLLFERKKAFILTEDEGLLRGTTSISFLPECFTSAISAVIAKLQKKLFGYREGTLSMDTDDKSMS